MEKLGFTHRFLCRAPQGRARVGREAWGGGEETVGEPLHYGFLGKDQVNHR